MKELKFRYWDKSNNCMIFSENLGLQDFFAIINDEEVPHKDIMQFAGIKDSQGIDIYAGDIVLNNGEFGNSHKLIYWSEYEEVGFSLYEQNQKLNSPDYDSIKLSIMGTTWWEQLSLSFLGSYTIIGNIYSNYKTYESIN